MKVYKALSEFTRLSNAVVTIGTYDGVHLGHQKILQSVITSTKSFNGESVVVTFWPHPKKILGYKASQDVKYLSTLDEKIEMLEALGIDHLLIIPFNRSFSELSSAEFIQTVLVDTIGTKKLIIGYDHRFGKDREGSFAYLQKNSVSLGFEVKEIPRQDLNEVAISSTHIREALSIGAVKKATQFLGKPYELKGIVSKGKQVGRTIGFPTANLKVTDVDKIIPSDGVYAVQVLHKGQIFGGMLNIGFRPTVDGKNKTIEAHIFDFEHTIYGEELAIRFIDYIRAEQKFSSKEALQEQLEKDKIAAISVLKK